MLYFFVICIHVVILSVFVVYIIFKNYSDLRNALAVVAACVNNVLILRLFLF